MFEKQNPNYQKRTGVVKGRLYVQFVNQQPKRVNGLENKKLIEKYTFFPEKEGRHTFLEITEEWENVE